MTVLHVKNKLALAEHSGQRMGGGEQEVERGRERGGEEDRWMRGLTDWDLERKGWKWKQKREREKQKPERELSKFSSRLRWSEGNE